MLLLMTLGATSVADVEKQYNKRFISLSPLQNASSIDTSSAGSTSSDSTASEEYASPSDVDGIPVVDEEVDPAECVTRDYKSSHWKRK